MDQDQSTRVEVVLPRGQLKRTIKQLCCCFPGYGWTPRSATVIHANWAPTQGQQAIFRDLVKQGRIPNAIAKGSGVLRAGLLSANKDHWWVELSETTFGPALYRYEGLEHVELVDTFRILDRKSVV